MSFITITCLFATGIVIGITLGYHLNREEYLKKSRKSLEKAIIESGIIKTELG